MAHASRCKFRQHLLHLQICLCFTSLGFEEKYWSVTAAVTAGKAARLGIGCTVSGCYENVNQADG